jgi:hypothetical protein
MALFMFRFLNKRKDSDFYHSIPVTRACLFFSYLAAILTWIAAIILLNLAAAGIVLAIYHRYITINVLSMFVFAGGIFIGCILVIAAILVAMSLTGTSAANILLTVLILFLPRAILFNITDSLTETVPFLDGFSAFPVLSSSYNLVIGPLFAIIVNQGEDIMAPFITASSQIYTLILACLYIALGCLLFTKRKSESAGFSAINKWVMGIIRCGCTFIVCLLPIYLIFYAETQEGSLVAYIDTIIIAYISAFVIYIVLELITNKSFKKLLASWPSLIIVAALNILTLASMFGLYNTTISTHWDSDEITGVTIASSAFSDNTDDYFVHMLLDAKLTDKTTIQTLSEQWQNAIDALKENKYGRLEANGSDCVVTFYQGSKKLKRVLPISTEALDTISNAYASDSELMYQCKNLPDIATGKFNATFYAPDEGLYNIVSGLTTDERKEIYTLFQQEIKDYPSNTLAAEIIAEPWDIFTSYQDSDDNSMGAILESPYTWSYNENWQPLLYINFTSYDGLQVYTGQYAITATVFPKTYAKLMELCLPKVETTDSKNLVTKLKNVLSEYDGTYNPYHLNFWCEELPPVTMHTASYFYADSDVSLEPMISLFEEASNNDTSEETYTVYVTAINDSIDYDTTTSPVYALSLTKAQWETLDQLCETRQEQ